MAPFVAPALAMLWPLLLVRSASSWKQNSAGYLLLLTGALWVVLSVLPVSAGFFVGADLQGARYLYLGSSVWSIAIAAALFSSASPAWRLPLRLVLAIILVGSALALRMQLEPWQEAGRVRDRILAEYESFGPPCVPTHVTGLPDHVAGAYVFRNGFLQATGSAATRSPEAQKRCAIAWTQSGFVVPD